jgi:ferredoxin-NADP reductase/Na+-transporting NADH:ubiquinone oxidoreductase subunit NqrB
MLTYIDYILDRVTMYRLALYYLIAIITVALGLSAFGLLPYTPLEILESTAILLVLCGVSNYVFAKVYQAPTNFESTYITALILVCILPPVHSIQDLPLLGWAAALSMASKYILAIRSKHIFNPAAIAVVLTALWLNQSAIWWVGTPYMAPIMVLGGLLLVRKLRHSDLVFSFMVTALVTSTLFTVLAGHTILQAVQEIVLRSPLLFFGFVMLTEPLTSPPTNFLQIIFGGLVGLLFAPQIHLGTIYSTPEIALVIGNIFSFIVSPKIKDRLVLVSNTSLTPDVVEFDFKPRHPISFKPGQYMEFTLPHTKADSRGTRRYFTIASSPTEESVKLGVKFYQNASSFKRSLFALQPTQSLMSGQLAGDFTLPTNPSQKVAFIAGGIGITPFRSMLKYMCDTDQKRPTTLIYVNKTAEEIAYSDVLAEAKSKIGSHIIHTLTGSLPENWQGRVGRITEQMITEEVPDYAQYLFYISGPQTMVSASEKILQNLGVKQDHIKKDFFHGLT